MKKQIVSMVLIVTAALSVTTSFLIDDAVAKELFKALSLVFLILGIKQMQLVVVIKQMPTPISSEQTVAHANTRELLSTQAPGYRHYA